MLVLFVTHLAACIKPQSTSVYLAGIHSLHVANGYSNPLLPGLWLKQTLCGIERKHFISFHRSEKCLSPLISYARSILL